MHQHFNECDGALSESELALNRVWRVWATQHNGELRLAWHALYSVQSSPVHSLPACQWYHNYFHLIEQRSVRVERSFFLYFLLFFLSFQRPGHIVWGARTETESTVWSSLATGLCLLRYMLECIRIYGQR